MLWAVLNKELIENFVSFRFWAGFAATLAIAVVVSWGGGEDYRLRREIGKGKKTAYDKELQSAHTYSQAQPTVVRAPEPLSILEPGFDSRLGVEVRIVPFRVPFAATGPSRGNELLATAPEVGLTDLVGLVLGFFALLLTFDSFARERESGALRLLEIQGLTPAKILLGKYLAGVLALSLPLAGSVAVAMERVYNRAGSLTGDQWLRVGWLSLACLGYLSCSTLWGLVFSLRAPSRTAALTRAAEAWLLTLLIIPVVAGTSAHDLLGQERRRQDLDAKIATLEKERDDRILKTIPWDWTFSGDFPTYLDTGSRWRTILIRHGSERYYELTSLHYAAEARITRCYAKKIAGLQRKREEAFLSGERFFATVSAVSPRVLLGRMAQALAGTSYLDHQRFLADCRHYHGEVQDYFERIGAFGSRRWFTDDPPGATYPWPFFLGMTPEEVDPGRAKQIALGLGRPEIHKEVQRYRKESDADPTRQLDLGGLPKFSSPEVPLASRLRETWGEILFLLLFHLGALAFARRGLRRQGGR